MNLFVVVALVAVFGLILLVSAARLLGRRHILGGLLCGLFALLLLVASAGVGLMAGNLVTYSRLTHEQRALTLAFSRTNDHEFSTILTFPAGEVQRVTLRGDEWQVDARIVKWKAFANLVGFDAAYRLERISGRYDDIAQERGEPHSVFPLAPGTRLDTWAVIKRFSQWLPWVDALYGSAVYVPMADGAVFEVMVSQSGLLVRPLNDAARHAVSGWHS